MENFLCNLNDGAFSSSRHKCCTRFSTWKLTLCSIIYNAIKEFKAGKLEFRADKAGIVHVRFGKARFTKEALFDNLKTLQESIDKNKPSGAKGKYWKTFYVTSTMGPSVQVDINATRLPTWRLTLCSIIWSAIIRPKKVGYFSCSKILNPTEDSS